MSNRPSITFFIHEDSFILIFFQNDREMSTISLHFWLTLLSINWFLLQRPGKKEIKNTQKICQMSVFHFPLKIYITKKSFCYSLLAVRFLFDILLNFFFARWFSHCIRCKVNPVVQCKCTFWKSKEKIILNWTNTCIKHYKHWKWNCDH